MKKSIILLLVVIVVVCFQAEDGIRDLTVTGVQTCALPISARRQKEIRPPTQDGNRRDWRHSHRRDVRWSGYARHGWQAIPGAGELRLQIQTRRGRYAEAHHHGRWRFSV